MDSHEKIVSELLLIVFEESGYPDQSDQQDYEID